MGRKKNIKKTIIITLGIGVFLSIIGFVILKQSIDYTNKTEYCLSCHEPLRDSYLSSSHGQNKTGIQVQCVSCHAPLMENDIENLSHKFLALKRPVAKFFGALKTEDDFNNKRLEMATNVWQWMKKSPEEGCRSCHSFKHMDLTKQESRAVQHHLKAAKNGQTCIACHAGIVHGMMEGGVKKHHELFWSH